LHGAKTMALKVGDEEQSNAVLDKLFFVSVGLLVLPCQRKEPFNTRGMLNRAEANIKYRV